MNKLIIVLSLIHLVVTGNSQVVTPPAVFQNSTDMNGKPLMANNRDVEGSPLLTEDWAKGIIQLAKGVVYKDVQINFNLETNEIYFNQNGSPLAVADEVQEAVFNYNKNGEEKQAILRAGYPAVASLNKHTLYFLLANGPKLQLLKYVFVKVEEIRNYSSGTHNQYVQKELLYLFDVTTNKIIFIKPTKSSLFEAVPAYEDRLEKIIADNALKIKNEKDLIELINAFNKIP